MKLSWDNFTPCNSIQQSSELARVPEGREERRGSEGRGASEFETNEMFIVGHKREGEGGREGRKRRYGAGRGKEGRKRRYGVERRKGRERRGQ